MTDKETIRQAMSLLGRAKSAAKRQAGTENLEKARAARYPLLLPCNCGGDPHKYACPVARRARTAKHAK